MYFQHGGLPVGRTRPTTTVSISTASFWLASSYRRGCRSACSWGYTSSESSESNCADAHCRIGLSVE